MKLKDPLLVSMELTITRALIRQTPILVLDEITSVLDNQTAYQIEKSLIEIENFTAIIVLKDGQIFEMDTHEELFEMKGYFYSMYAIQ